MGTKKWSEIKKLSKATDADRAEARAELEAELGRAAAPPHGTVREILDNADELADWFEAFNPADGIERPVEELLEARRKRARANDGHEFGTAAPRGRPKIDRHVLDRQLTELAGHPVSLPADAIGYEAPDSCPVCSSTEILWVAMTMCTTLRGRSTQSCGTQRSRWPIHMCAEHAKRDGSNPMNRSQFRGFGHTGSKAEPADDGGQFLEVQALMSWSGDPTNFALAVGARNENSTLRILDVWIGGTRTTTRDNLAYVPQICHTLEMEAQRFAARSDWDEPYPGVSLAEQHRRLEEVDDGSEERFWFMHWGPTTDNCSTFVFRCGPDVAITCRNLDVPNDGRIVEDVLQAKVTEDELVRLLLGASSALAGP